MDELKMDEKVHFGGVRTNVSSRNRSPRRKKVAKNTRQNTTHPLFFLVQHIAYSNNFTAFIQMITSKYHVELPRSYNSYIFIVILPMKKLNRYVKFKESGFHPTFPCPDHVTCKGPEENFIAPLKTIYHFVLSS